MGTAQMTQSVRQGRADFKHFTSLSWVCSIKLQRGQGEMKQHESTLLLSVACIWCFRLKPSCENLSLSCQMQSPISLHGWMHKLQKSGLAELSDVVVAARDH